MTGPLIDLVSLWEVKYYYLDTLYLCKYAASSNIDTKSCAKSILWHEVYIVINFIEYPVANYNCISNYRQWPQPLWTHFTSVPMRHVMRVNNYPRQHKHVCIQLVHVQLCLKSKKLSDGASSSKIRKQCQMVYTSSDTMQ